MADTVANVLYGGASVSLGAWVTAGGAGTLTDVGIILGGLKFSNKRTYHKIESDHHLGELGAFKTKDVTNIKFKIQELSMVNLAKALDQSAPTGTAPNTTILHSPNLQAQKLQVQVTGPGLGTTLLRTLTAWMGIVTANSDIDINKTKPQETEITIDFMQDLSVATADKDYKFVDS